MNILLRILPAVALAIPAALTGAESVPYASDLGADYKISPDWQNVTRSEKYWEYDRESDFSTPGTTGGAMHTWDQKDVDAMLISPAITLTEGTTYTVGFWVKTHGNAGGDREAFKLLMGNEGEFSALKATTPLIDVTDYRNNDDFERRSATFTATAGGDTYFGIYCCSGSWQGNLCVTGFSIAEGDKDVLPEKPEVIKDVPFTANFSSGAGFKEWSSLAGPDAGVTNPWSFNSYSGFAEFDWASGLKEDNYFISPAINVEAAGDYLISMTYTAQGSFDVVLGTDNTDPASFGTVLASFDDVNEFSTEAEIPVAIAAPGKYYIALHLRAESGSMMGYRLHAFKFKNNASVPALVNDLKATADPADALKVTLEWTNPSQTHTGGALDAITKIEISRNGELLATLTDNLTPGAGATYEDLPAEAGAYEYSLTVYGTNGAFDAEPMVAKAGFVGRPTADYPFSVDINFASADELAKYTSEDANNDGLTWEVVTEYYTTTFTSKNGSDEETESADNYLATPYIHLVPGYYLFTSNIAAHSNNFEVGIATDRHNIAGTFTLLGGINDQQEYSYNDYKVVVPIDVEGDYCLVWHHTGMSTNYAYKSVSLRSASLVDQPLLPGVATSLSAKSAVGAYDVEISWINPAVDNANRELKAISRAEVLRDGELLATVTENLVPGEESVYTDSSLDASGEHTYSVVVYNENGCAEDDAPAVSLFVGTGRELPYTADFNEWTIVDLGSYHAWAVDNNGAAYFERGMFDDVEYNDGIYSPYLLLEEGKRYIVTFHTFGVNELQEGTFTLQAGQSRDAAADLMEITKSGVAEEEHTVVLLPQSAAALDDAANGDDKVVPAGNIVIGFHIAQNAAVNIRDFKIEADPNYSATESVAVEATAAVAVADGIAFFAADATDVVVADVTGRVLFTAAVAPASLDLRTIAPKGILIVKAVAPAGTATTLKVTL